MGAENLDILKITNKIYYLRSNNSDVFQRPGSSDKEPKRSPKPDFSSLVLMSSFDLETEGMTTCWEANSSELTEHSSGFSCEYFWHNKILYEIRILKKYVFEILKVKYNT